MGAALTLDSALPMELVPPSTLVGFDGQQPNLRARVERILRKNRRLLSVEHRTVSRWPLPVLLELRPLEREVPAALAIRLVVVGKDLSESGIGFFHDSPIPYRRGIVTFHPSDGASLSVEVDLSWCRFTRMGWYESGGRLIRLVDDNDLLATA